MLTRQQIFWDSATMHDDLCTMQSNKLTAIVWILSCVVFQLYAEHPVELKELKWKRGEQTYRTECRLRLFCCARQSGSLLFTDCNMVYTVLQCNAHRETSWVPSPIKIFVNCIHWYSTSAIIVLPRIIETIPGPSESIYLHQYLN